MLGAIDSKDTGSERVGFGGYTQGFGAGCAGHGILFRWSLIKVLILGFTWSKGFGRNVRRLLGLAGLQNVCGMDGYWHTYVTGLVGCT